MGEQSRRRIMQRFSRDNDVEGKRSGGWFCVIQHSKLLLLAFLVCGTLLLNGCAFWALSGEGPMSKSEAYQTIKRAPLKMTASEQKLAKKLYRETLDKRGFPERKNKASNYAVGKALATGLFTLGLNLRIEGVCVEQPGKLENSLYTCDKGVIPGYPLMWPWWSEWVTTYNMETGEEVRQSKVHGLGLASCLGGYACIVSPEIKNKRLPFAPSSFGERYNVKTAYHVLFGAFAKGQVNHKKYLQIFWIPIPVGSVDG